ncbi:uncharacterized protein LOC134262405 [Saccostrea cucullata]|uniref:uncharacterized protein LOC134262405 n=1 Tax=Saccostrea cuccullata TaxID=36930 RepID=UPI002ED05610
MNVKTRRKKVKCPNGYTGTGCVLQCEYPSYGERCQYECRCESALCDPANGCYVLTTEYSLILEDQRSTVNFQQYTTLKNLYEYQSITSSQMNISIHPQLVAGSYQAVLIASVSSIVLFAFVVSVLICLRNVKLQNWMTTNTANTHESGIATVEEGLRNMQEENRHLNSFESQDFPFVNEQVSSLYEEIKENSPGHEKKAEHIYLPISENEELNDDRVNDNDMDSYISPVNVLVDHKRHITGSKLYEGGYITPI